MPIHLNGKVYKTVIRPMIMYGAEASTLTRREEGLLESTEMRMLQWILGVSLRDKKRIEVIRKKLGVASITHDKIREARMRWYGHVMRKEVENCVKRIMRAGVTGRHHITPILKSLQ